MTGTQDYFPAVAAGLSAIHYTPDGPRQEHLALDPGYWNQRMSLIYTGQPHHSGLNNWTVIKAALDGHEGTLNALWDIKRVADKMLSVLRVKALQKLPDLFAEEFEARVRLSSGFSSPEIEQLKDVALSKGASAIKICGAGGGGCVLLLSEPDAKPRVEDACREQGFEVLKAAVVEQASH
jgi:D-glycero-alpha-D-manno-heptose-7-phosphate kinase